MNCDETRRHWHLFHDSEGDAELHHQINEHLGMCPDCARWFYQQSRLEDALVEKLRRGEPTKALWDNIRRQCFTPEPAAARSWFTLHRALFLAACVLILAITSITYWGDRAFTSSPDLAALSAALHEKLASGQEAVKLTSRSDAEIEDYLQRQVAFPVRCPPREDAGFQVEGGGVCKFDAHPVAYVVGQVDGRRVSVFVMARESLATFPAQAEAIRRHSIYTDHLRNLDIVMREIDRNVVLVVGQNGPRLLGVLNAYGSYHDHRRASPRHSEGRYQLNSADPSEGSAMRTLDRYVGWMPTRTE